MLEVGWHVTMMGVGLTLAVYVWVIILFLFRDQGIRPRFINLASILLLLWIMFQSALALNRWYMDRNSAWPHWLFAVLFPCLLMMLQFTLSRARNWAKTIQNSGLIWLHLLRIPLAWLLTWLSVDHQLPMRWTYFGWNFDIVFGVTAPIVAILWQRGHRGAWIRGWHFAGLASLLWLWIGGLLSTAGAWQVWDVNAPNYAFVHFPFIWIPTFILPILIWSHSLSLQKNHASIES
ncbi:MAG: hypothetical protein ACKOZY_12830 [Flavobacteriales bacterium]